jgi:hypothetical protein
MRKNGGDSMNETIQAGILALLSVALFALAQSITLLLN